MLFNFFNVDSGNKINANFIKNPHQLQLMSKIKLVESNIDTDKQLLGPIVLSNEKYYLELEFNRFILNENTVGKLSILHVNNHSFNKNLDNLLILLKSVKYKFSILAICETWETNSKVDILQIPAYVRASIWRWWWIVLIIEHGINFKVRNNLILDYGIVDKSCECIFIEIHNAKK